MANQSASMIAKNFTKHRGGGTLFGKPRSEVIKHPGSFTRSAKRAGKSVHALAEADKHESGTQGRRARLALAFENMRRKK